MFFFFRCEEVRVENSFFCLRPDRGSLVLGGVAVGFKWQNVKAQKNFSLFEFFRVGLLGGGGCILFTSSFPSLRGGCLMCVCSLAYALIAYL